ncbi:MAG: diguanylate cyclase [Acidimicrobiales bacterium]
MGLTGMKVDSDELEPSAWRSFAFENLPSPAVVLNGEGTIVAVNEAWTVFSLLNGGDPETSGVGASYLGVCDVAASDVDDASAVGVGIRRLLEGDIERFEHEYPCHSPHEDRWFLLQASALHDATGVVLFHVNITGRKMLEDRLAREVELDTLTGLANRRGVMSHLSDVLGRDTDLDGAVTVFFADLDRFKPVNDRLGHASGDELLAAVGRRLRRIAREGVDLVGRLGGDEFVVILAGLAEDDVDMVVERMRISIESPFQLGDRAVTVGVSIGVVRSSPTATAESLLEKADAAMYADKKSRNAGR